MVIIKLIVGLKLSNNKIANNKIILIAIPPV